jgi:hypothetical protein
MFQLRPCQLTISSRPGDCSAMVMKHTRIVIPADVRKFKLGEKREWRVTKWRDQ